jgi:hypothetical protein
MKPETKKLWVDRATMAIAVAGLLWIVAGYISLGVLAHAAPLTEMDLKSASWLSSPNLALHFTGGSRGWFWIGAAWVVALGMLVVRRNAVPLFGAVAISLVICALDEAAVMRVGALDGVVRIGCYVPGSSECLQLAGLPSQGAPSMYSTPRGQQAEWYSQERIKAVSRQQEVMAGWHSVPGAALLRAPLFLTSGDRLKALLDAQRKELASFKAAAMGGKA